MPPSHYAPDPDSIMPAPVLSRARAMTTRGPKRAARNGHGQVPDEADGPDQPHLGVVKPQALAHGRKDHGVRKTADPERSRDVEHTEKRITYP